MKTKKTVGILLTFVVALGLIWTAACTPRVTEPPETPGNPSRTPASSSEVTSSAGASTLSDEILSAHFGFLGTTFDAEELSELGIRWDRPHPGPFIWGRIERQKGEYDWREVDRYIQQAQDYGFATLATIWPFAEWDQAGWGETSRSGVVFEREMGMDILHRKGCRR
ncbi:MAG: hypothetical protein Q8O55_08610 [Dehalococcoidales bacterium]|nr:hypothetical protein [Dehalococcoidales bacterium]